MQSTQYRVALVTCLAYPQLYEDDLLLFPELEQLGISALPAVWSDAEVDVVRPDESNAEMHIRQVVFRRIDHRY